MQADHCRNGESPVQPCIHNLPAETVTLGLNLPSGWTIGTIGDLPSYRGGEGPELSYHKFIPNRRPARTGGQLIGEKRRPARTGGRLLHENENDAENENRGHRGHDTAGTLRRCKKDAARVAQRLADRLAIGVAHKQHARLKTTLHTNPPSERRRSNRQNAS